MKKPKVEYPDWMTEYPPEFWEDSKVQEYVKLANEYFQTMRAKKKKEYD